MAARVVHKYEVGYGQVSTEMPVGAKLLHVGAAAVSETVFVWAEVDPDAKMELRPIGYFGTGHSLPVDAEYVGTAVVADGAYVWHVYERVAI